MKFINNGEAVQVREQEGPNRYKWTLLKTGETIELPQDVGVRYGFIEVFATKGNIGKVEVETKQIERGVDSFDAQQDFFKELIKIKDIGKKTARDITKVYPTRENLIKAISNNDELPFRDDVEKLLRDEYGK